MEPRGLAAAGVIALPRSVSDPQLPSQIEVFRYSAHQMDLAKVAPWLRQRDGAAGISSGHVLPS